jgi:hypothetical protein
MNKKGEKVEGGGGSGRPPRIRTGAMRDTDEQVGELWLGQRVVSVNGPKGGCVRPTKN